MSKPRAKVVRCRRMSARAVHEHTTLNFQVYTSRLSHPVQMSDNESFSSTSDSPKHSRFQMVWFKQFVLHLQSFIGKNIF